MIEQITHLKNMQGLNEDQIIDLKLKDLNWMAISIELLLASLLIKPLKKALSLVKMEQCSKKLARNLEKQLKDF